MKTKFRLLPLLVIVVIASQLGLGLSSYRAHADASVVITSPVAGQAIGAGSPTVTGTAPAAVVVQVSIDGVVVGTATANVSGEWSLQAANVSPGNHTLSAQLMAQHQYAYLANRSFNTIDVVDVVTHSYVQEINGPNPYYAAIFNPRNNKMYAASTWFGRCALKTFNATSFAIEDSVSMSADGSYPVSMALDAAGNNLYEVCYDGDSGYNVIVYDTNTNNPTGSFDLGLDPGEFPGGIAINPSNTQIWVRINGGVKVYNVSDHANIESLAINPGNINTNNIVFNQDGSKAYTAESDISDLYVINTSDFSVTTYGIDSYLTNLAFTPDYSKLYAISAGTSSIYVIDPADGSVIDSQVTAQPPESLAITSDGASFVVGDDHGSGQIYFGAVSGNSTVTHTITAPNGGSYYTSTGNFIGSIHYAPTGEAVTVQFNAYGAPNTGLGRL